MPRLDQHLASRAELNRRIEQVVDLASRPGRFVWVEGAPGAGRSLLVNALRDAHADAVVVEPPSLEDVDAPLHALTQLAVNTGSATTRRRALDHTVPWQVRSREAGNDLANNHGCLILRLPADWTAERSGGTELEALLRERVTDLLLGLKDAVGLTVILVVVSRGRFARRLSIEDPVRLPAPRLDPDALDDVAAWGDLKDYAAAVRDVRRAKTGELSPFQVRLLIGLASLGVPVERLIADVPSWPGCKPVPSLDLLIAVLRAQLKRPEHFDLRRGLTTIANARFPLDTEDALKIGEIPVKHHLFVTECLGYGEGAIRFTAPVREALLDLARETPEPSATVKAHQKLVDYYRVRDGANRLDQVRRDTVKHWLEKLRNAARAGVGYDHEWREQEKPGPELYWDRARFLSMELEDYGAAADVYKECAEAFPKDAYAWHYYAWNLDRAKDRDEPANVSRAFRHAVEVERDNPWWNSRLITHLIGVGRYREAEAAWQEALENVDPTRERVQRDPWLSRHMFRWVTRAWLDAGEVERGAAVFALIPRSIIEGDEKLHELEARLLDELEARELRDSVYPAGFPVVERWRRPALVADEGPNGQTLKAWFPARILDFDGQRLDVVLGIPDERLEVASEVMDERPARHRLVRTFLTREDWENGGGWCRIDRAEGFFILARYEDDSLRIYPVVVPRASWEAPSDEEKRAIERLRRWARLSVVASRGIR